MDIIKRHTWCPKCGDCVSIYIGEKERLEGIETECKCGATLRCVRDSKVIVLWEVVE